MTAITAGTLAGPEGTITGAILRSTNPPSQTLKSMQKGSQAAPFFACFAVSSRKRADYALVSRATRTARAV
jgi:hypothetical protein